MIREHISFHGRWADAIDAWTIRAIEDGEDNVKIYQIRWRPQYNKFEFVERIEGDTIVDKPNESRRLKRGRKNAKSQNRRDRGSVPNPE
jgi:hypothetical protein